MLFCQALSHSSQWMLTFRRDRVDSERQEVRRWRGQMWLFPTLVIGLRQSEVAKVSFLLNSPSLPNRNFPFLHLAAIVYKYRVDLPP